MDHWDEVRTAYQVARQGTVSGAAEVLGVHHATVIRHIDALEARLGVKLFQRHARGYTPTESGQDLARVAQTTEDQLQQLVGRIKGRGSEVSGELLVTSLVELSPFMVPVLSSFQIEHPEVIIRYLTDARLFRLEYGEAHVAVRAGSVPGEPDNVVQPFTTLRFGLYAARSYVSRNGLPGDESELGNHVFIGSDNPEGRAPYQKWLRTNVPYERVVFRSSDSRIMRRALLEGVGIGFAEKKSGDADPDLVEVLPHRPDWEAPLWLVTHVDLHRTAKVQALLTHLKNAVADNGLETG